MAVCKFCGAEARFIKEEKGVKYYNCVFCGSSYEETVAQPAGASSCADDGKKPFSGEEIYSKMEQSTVEIFCMAGESCFSGSGFFISSKGFVVTNAHVVMNNGRLVDEIYVKLADGNKAKATVMAVGSPEENGIDLALLFVPAMKDNAVPAEMGDSAAVKNGERIYVIGNSLGEGTCITSGIVSDNHRRIGNQEFIMTDAAVNPGNSGGPLVNEYAQVVSVIVSGRINSDGMKYSIPSETVKQFINYVEDKTKFDLGVKRDQFEQLGVKKILSNIIIILQNVLNIVALFA